MSVTASFAQVNDSLLQKSISGSTGISGFISTSFMWNKNWKEQSNSAFLLAVNLKMRSSDQRSIRRITEVQTELSYIKFIDSVWVKINDRFFLSNIWLLDKKKLKQTLSFSFISQLTDTWIEETDGTTTERYWKSGPLLPASATGGYGFIYKPSYKNYINISFPAYKISSLPDPLSIDKLQIVSRKNSYIIHHSYGMNLQSNVEKKISAKIIFQNNSQLLVTRANDYQYYADIINSLSWRPVSILKIRFEQRILYDEFYSKKLQFKYDFLIGIYFE